MAAAAKFEEFDPRSEIQPEKEYDTILVFVPGFKKGQLRVHLTSTNLIRVSGEKEADGKILRFRKEFPLDPNYNTNRISAKFDKETLHVKLPKKRADQQVSTSATTMASEMSQGLSRRALYAVLAGLVAVVVGVGLYFTNY